MQMTQECIDSFLQYQRDSGVSNDAFRQRKGFVPFLYCWLPEDKELAKERLGLWRTDMPQKGYTQQTILNYVKGIHLYLNLMGWSEIRFNRGRAKYMPTLLIRANDIIGAPIPNRRLRSKLVQGRKNRAAYITYAKKRHVLGYFSKKEDAIAVRKKAERKLIKDPQSFVEEQGLKKELCV